MNQTKRSLFNSVIALLLCFTTLLGTTFAWFTDVSFSKGNIIQTGNLKAEMYWAESYDAPTAEWTNAKDGPVFTYDNWEPGYTDVKYIKVKNEGNLSFKWQLTIEAENELTKLADVIDVYYVNPIYSSLTTLAGKTSSGTLTEVVEERKATSGKLLPSGTYEEGYITGETILAIALHMDEDANNDYQTLSIGGGFEVNLIATQMDFESDSFGSSYDNEAQWPSTVITGDKVASAPVTPTADNKVDANGVNIDIDGGKYNASVPEGTKLEDGADKLTFVINNVDESQANITLGENEASLSLDVHVYGIAPDNDKVIKIYMAEKLPVGLNMGNYRFYHVENGVTNEMTYITNPADAAHNTFEYDPNTGDVVIYLKSFSEVALVADTTKAWTGGFDYSWYDADATKLTIANADQLAAFGAIVGGMKVVTGRNGNAYTYSDEVIQDSFSGQTITLLADINLGYNEDENTPNLIFHPIGYWNNEGTYERKPLEERVTAVSSGFYTFEGTFDGNGNTIENFYQNTWEIKGDHNWYSAVTEQYFRDGMGLFGRIYKGTVKNLTVKNFSSDGEITTTGTIAAYAEGATFENIAIFNCNPRVYNIGNGGIVGCVGWYAKEANLKTTFKNITVDNSNKISALWGTYDAACGGIVGQYYPTSGQSSYNYPVNGGISFENCHISAQMDVYNDVCANYQYYAYRYTGMLIGSVRENVTIDGHSYPKMDGITAEGCTVHFGDWNDYYYCEIVANSLASYTHDHQFSRLEQVAAVNGTTITYLDGKTGTVPASGWAHYVVVNAKKADGTFDHKDENATCYHFNNGEVWEHEDAGYETVNGVKVLKEDKQHVYLEFNNLVTGYGWGVTSRGFNNLDGVTNLDISEGNQESSVEKFEGKNNITTYRPGETITISDLFGIKGNAVINGTSVYVSVSPVTDDDKVSATFQLNAEDWTKSTITFAADSTGTAKITITDYIFCTPTTIYLYEEKEVQKFDANSIGAQNAYTQISLGTLFSIVEGTTVKESVNITIKDPSNNVIEIKNSLDWANEKINLVKDGKWTVTIKENDDYCSATSTEFTVNEIKQFNANSLTGKTTYTTLSIDDIFSKVNADLTVNNVIVKVTKNGVSDNLDGNTIILDKSGNWAVTITADACEPVTAEFTVAKADKFNKKFDKDFLYRVGNASGSTVSLGTLFEEIETSVNLSSINVVIDNVAGNASGTYTSNTTWTNGYIQFNNTGVVKVTISADATNSVILYLEVVDAKNYSGATGESLDAKENNVVLLTNIGSGFTVSGEHTFYGNGFTLNYTEVGKYLNNGLSYGIVNVKDNGTLDNLRIIASIYPKAYMYYGATLLGDYVQGGLYDVGPNGNQYYYQFSAVATTGDATISNCYIYGGRNNVYASTGNVTITDTILECGTLANLQIKSTDGYTVTLNNLTTIQYKVNATVGDTTQAMLGAGIIVGPETETNPNIVLNGNFKQYNWVNANDKENATNLMAQMLIGGALDATAYNHTVDGQTASNLGIIYMNEAKINVANNTGLPYREGTVSMSYKGTTVNGQVYSLQGATAGQIYSDYVNADRKTVNGDYIPAFDFNLGNQEISYDGSDDTRYLYGDKDGVIALYQDGNDPLTLDLTKLATIYKYSGINYDVTVVCKDSNGNKLTATNGVVTLDAQGSYTLIFTVEDNIFYDKNGETISKSVTRTYTVPLTLTVKEANVKNADVKITKTALDGVYTTVNLTDYKLRINFLDAISITDYDNKGNGTTVSLSSNIASATLTPSSVNVFTTAFTVTITYTDGRMLTVNFSNISGSSPGNPKTATLNTSGGVYVITDSALDNKPTESKNQNKCTITSVSYKGNSGSTVTNDTDVTITWALGSSGGTTPCVTNDTLVTLADGTQKRIDQITYDDKLLVWDFYNGEYAVVPAAIIFDHGYGDNTVIKLDFSNGASVKVVNMHQFFDATLNKMVTINAENVEQYVGHEFIKQDGNGYSTVTLDNYTITNEYVEAWGVMSALHYNIIVEGIFSADFDPADLGLFNYFEIGEDMKYDEEQIKADIEKYGLYTYEDFADVLTYEQFIAFNVQYFKISVEKGNYTYEGILALIDKYLSTPAV